MHVGDEEPVTLSLNEFDKSVTTAAALFSTKSRSTFVSTWEKEMGKFIK